MFEKTLRDALALEIPYSHSENRIFLEHLNPNPIQAAVLILFSFDQASPFILYILRTETVLTHKGQISFPGGVTDPGEEGNPRATALRETYEEVGISPDRIRTLGELPSLLTVTGYEIHPIIGVTECPRQKLELKINPNEVAEVLWVSLDVLKHPNTYRQEALSRAGVDFPIDVYQVQEADVPGLSQERIHRIWGATGSITKNLLDRLAQLR